MKNRNVCFQLLLILNVVEYAPPSYGDYKYPGWALFIGWIIVSLPIVLIFGWALFLFCKKGAYVVYIDNFLGLQLI